MQVRNEESFLDFKHLFFSLFIMAQQTKSEQRQFAVNAEQTRDEIKANKSKTKNKQARATRNKMKLFRTGVKLCVLCSNANN